MNENIIAKKCHGKRDVDGAIGELWEENYNTSPTCLLSCLRLLFLPSQPASIHVLHNLCIFPGLFTSFASLLRLSSAECSLSAILSSPVNWKSSATQKMSNRTNVLREHKVFFNEKKKKRRNTRHNCKGQRVQELIRKRLWLNRCLFSFFDKFNVFPFSFCFIVWTGKGPFEKGPFKNNPSEKSLFREAMRKKNQLLTKSCVC